MSGGRQRHPQNPALQQVVRTHGFFSFSVTKNGSCERLHRARAREARTTRKLQLTDSGTSTAQFVYFNILHILHSGGKQGERRARCLGPAGQATDQERAGLTSAGTGHRALGTGRFVRASFPSSSKKGRCREVAKEGGPPPSIAPSPLWPVYGRKSLPRSVDPGQSSEPLDRGERRQRVRSDR